jgi:hypothetical protein
MSIKRKKKQPKTWKECLDITNNIMMAEIQMGSEIPECFWL